MKTLLTTLAALNFYLVAAQTGAIRGTIVDDNASPIPFVSVGITGSSFGTTTKEDGTYLISDIPYGTHRLEVSSLGFFTPPAEGRNKQRFYHS